MPSSSSTLHGLFTWPEMQNTFGPVFFGRPSALNQAAPRRMMVGATAMLSTLFTVDGQPYSPTAGRERRLQPRHALLAFQAFQQPGFLAADIGAGAAMQNDIEIPAGAAGVLADQPGRVGFLDRRLQHAALR